DDLGDGYIRAYDAGLLSALQKRFARVEERCAGYPEELGVLVEVVEQLVGERLLGRDVSDEALKPALEGFPGVGGVELRGRAADLFDLIDIESLQQRLAIRKVAVERPDADVGAARDLLESRRLPALGERLASSREHLLVVTARIGALRARNQRLRGCFGRAHSKKSLDKRRGPPYSTGGYLQMFRRWPPF